VRNLSWSEVKGVKKTIKNHIELGDIMTCSLTPVEKISKMPMYREDGSPVTNAFAVVTQKRTWYFAANRKTDAEIWVAVLSACCGPKS
jgi:hypothetical protein